MWRFTHQRKCNLGRRNACKNRDEQSIFKPRRTLIEAYQNALETFYSRPVARVNREQKKKITVLAQLLLCVAVHIASVTGKKATSNLSQIIGNCPE